MAATTSTPPTAMSNTAGAGQVNLETPVSLRVTVHGVTRKFKLPLGDLTAQVLPGKLRSLLDVPEGQAVTFERFSDSAGCYVTLDPNNAHVYKTLFRAAKAKLKLRLRVTYPGTPPYPPVALPGAFAAAFPEFNRFNASQSTLTAVNTEPTVRVQGSAETLSPFATGETNQTETTSQTKPSRESFFNDLGKRELSLRLKEPIMSAAAMCSWSVFCNACDRPMADAHYHCNVCDDGDYDLCETCVNNGTHCLGESHWLVKRFVKNGQVVSSVTERLSPQKNSSKETLIPEMPGAFTEEKKTEEPEESILQATRTCNCCIKEDQEGHFVTCLDCPDYDLCIPCHEANNHGHHPAHKFKAIGEDVPLSPLAEFLCASGRNTKHAALCDGCDKPIFGIRHKCLNCPDWDYCSECVKNASFIHPGHRFAPLYEPISAPQYRKARHFGIYCDGPLCEDKHDYIEGTRYKCAICHDTDFCASCEAYPHNKHNHTHPLIQFKTPVRNATITTVHEDQYGRSLAPKGDRNAAKTASGKAPANAATQVQTIIDVQPAEAPAGAPAYKPSKEKIEIKDLLAEPIQEKIKVQDLLSSPSKEAKQPFDINKLNAVFVRETVPDGTVVNPDLVFTQVWTLRNPGPATWPAGCSVRYTGGDNMLGGMTEVTESNIIDRAVDVGEEISFRVPLRAPATPGTKISYWRLKTADGQAFGHRLWCHVAVAASAEAGIKTVPSHIAPAELSNGQASQWKDTFLHQALQHRVDRAQAIEKQRIELEKIKARHSAKQLADAQARAHRSEMLRRLSTEISAIETQYKARNGAAQAAIDAARAALAPTSPPQTQPASELPAVSPAFIAPTNSAQDYQMQLMLLEQQNKQRLTQARQEQEKMIVNASLAAQIPPSAPSAPRGPIGLSGHALRDWQMQLMLLEQQNKKRLLMARQEQEQTREVTAPIPAPATSKPVEVDAEVRPVTVEDVVDEEDTVKPEVQKSNMIFPKLDKESPVSSTADVSTSTAPAGVPSTPAAKSEKSDKSEEIFEDAESVSFVDSSDEGEGFLTDEEYDILDASDEDITA